MLSPHSKIKPDLARKGKTRIDWVEEGQRVLREGGAEAVKLHCLTQRLGVSTGSFYYHFQNFDEYLTFLADYYGSEQADRLFDKARETAGDDPRALLKEATRQFGAGSGRQLNIAMRAWAQQDSRASASIRRYDEALIGHLDKIFLALGYNVLEAKSRTLILVGLATLDVDPDLLEPSFTDRWLYIRDKMILPAE